MPTELDLVTALDRELTSHRKRLLRDDAYYEGEQPLRFMAAAIEAEVGDRITQLVLNWCRLGADAYENRADIEGFRYAGDDSADAALWEMWQANDGDEQAQQGHLESLIHGRSFVIVGAGDTGDDSPVMTVEHPLQVAVHRDPRTRQVSSAIKRWKDDDRKQRAALYLPDSSVQFVRDGRGWRELADLRDDHNLGAVPVVPLVNSARMLRQHGRSEFHDVIPVADAANKMATDMMISGEFHAMPRRWAVGMTEDDFVDENDNPVGAWSAVAGRLWSTDKAPKDVAVGQFQEADLANFHNTIKLLAQITGHLLYLPGDYLSFTSDNPASADAIRASESRFVKRCERKHTTWGGGWEQVQRLMLRIQTGKWDLKARSLETLWRDPSTPTIAQKADAVTKLRAQKIITLEQAREDLGYTSEQRRRMAEQDALETDRNLLGSLADQFRQPPAPATDPALSGVPA